MKVRVSYIVDVDDGFRRAIVHCSGGETTKDGLATRATVVDWFRLHGDSMDDDLTFDHADCCFRFEQESR